jgi:hypothetical protein
MAIVRIIPVLFVCAAFAAPALAAPVAAPASSGDRLVLVDNHGGEKGKKKAKGQEGAKKNADRSNEGGETRGAERSDQVQGMQSGKGATKGKQ